MLGIYIHIPFCRAKCSYCDFNSHVFCGEERELYKDALCREIKKAKKSGEAVVDTVYFGGGTPTVMEPRQLVDILDVIRGEFTLAENCEITTECNPATIDKKGFEILRGGGFNRISTGLQSANDGELKILGRIHSAAQGAECIQAAKDAGFSNISADLMFGLPKQSKESWKRSVEFALGLGITHISCYALKIEDGTPFSQMKLNLPSDDESCDMYDECRKILYDNGFMRYEISNFAKKGFESRHNLKYWRYDDFIGFGAGACSCLNGVRYSNIRDTAKYIKAVNDNDTLAEASETLDKSDMMSEFMFLGLRTAEGICENEFKRRFGTDVFDVFGDALLKNINRGTMLREGGRLRIPDKYIYVCNSIMVDFV